MSQRRRPLIGDITRAAMLPPPELTPLWDSIAERCGGDYVIADEIIRDVQALVERRLAKKDPRKSSEK